jgi:hypothetical protein
MESFDQSLKHLLHHASTLVRLLTHRLGALEPDLWRRIRSCNDADTLEAWTEEIFLAADEGTVRRVVDKISKAIPV